MDNPFEFINISIVTKTSSKFSSSLKHLVLFISSNVKVFLNISSFNVTVNSIDFSNVLKVKSNSLNSSDLIIYDFVGYS